MNSATLVFGSYGVRSNTNDSTYQHCSRNVNVNMVNIAEWTLKKEDFLLNEANTKSFTMLNIEIS